MDIFKGIGDFFRGAFGGDSEEEKKRKQRQQQQQANEIRKKAASNTLVKPPRPQMEQEKKTTVSEVNQLFGQKKPQLQQTNVVEKAPVLAIKEKPIKIGDFVYRKNADGTFTSNEGKIRTQEQLKKLNDAEKVYQARKSKIETDKYIGNVTEPLRATGKVATSIAQGAARIPETALRSGAELATGKEQSQKEKNTGLRQFFYGDEAIDTYQKQGTDTNAAIKQMTNDKVDIPAPLIAAALFGLDFTGTIGGAAVATKGALKGATKSSAQELATGAVAKPVPKVTAEEAGKIVAQRVQEEAGRTLTTEEMKVITEKATKQAQAQLETNPTMFDMEIRANDDATNKLRAVAEDASEPAFRRREAARQVEEADNKLRQADFDADPNNVPAYQHKRDMQRIVDQGNKEFSDYINENPNLTPQEIEAARESIKEQIIKLTDELKASRTANTEAVEGQVDDVAANAQQQADVNAQIVDERVASTTPQEGDALPPAKADPQVAANNAYNQTNTGTDEYIRTSDLSSKDGRRSPEVTPEQFQEHRKVGKQKLDALNQGSTPPTAIEDPASWNNIVDETYNMTREEWGGATIDTHTGKHVPVDADAYALTIKDPGMKSVSVSPKASPAEFAQAMAEAKKRFAHILARQKSHLGVFHDADTGMIDIDPVLITDNLEDVHDIGAYTRSTGGAYHFKSGDGFWAPHIADDAVPPAGAVPEQSADELLANDSFASQYNNTFDMTDEILRQADIDPSQGGTKESGLKKFFHKATGGGIGDKYKDMVDGIRNNLSARAMELQKGNVFQTVPNRIVSLFANNAGLSDAIRQVMRVRNDAQSAAGDAVKRLHDNISDKVAQLDMPPEQFNELLDRVFETPEFLARKYGDNAAKVAIDSLPPAEREIVDQLIAANKLRNLALFRQGKISIGEYKMFEDGMHSPRLYDFEKQSFGSKGNKIIDTTSTQKRKDLSEISDETFDKLIESPAQRMLIRLEMAMRSNASNDALKAYDEAGMLLNAPPNNQFSKLEGAKWGNYQGKYVYNPIKGQLEDSIVMNTKAGQSFNDILDQYRNSPFGSVDRFMKKTKTVYSPGTFIGNVLSNPLLFNVGAGVNPLGQVTRMAKASADLYAHRTGKNFNPDIYEAQRYGVFSSDTGKQITGENNPQLSVANNKRTNPFEAAYGGADDAAKLAVWRGLRRRGVPPEKAAQRVAQFTQDYNNAGRLVRSLADMPVLGKPFARFAPELVRLVKNNMMYNPVGMVAGVAGIAYIQDQLSKNAGETPEEREARETAMGQTMIPGTAWLNKLTTGTDRDVSLNFPVEPVPGQPSAVNIARAVGLNFPQDESGDPNMALVKSLVPFAIPTRDNAQGEMVIAPEELFTSLAWSPVAQQVADRDFMGRQISDPTNRFYYEDGSNEVRKFSGDNPDAMTDRFRHLFQSYVPLANEGGAVTSAVMGEKDYYGKERTVPEAIARMFGFKTESNTPEARQARIDTKQYFEEDLDAVQKFVTDNPDLAEAYFQLKNPTRSRPTDENPNGVKDSDLITPERWDIINSDTSGRLFNFLKEQAIAQNQKSIQEAERDPSKKIRPVDPLFMLPPDQAKYVQELRSRPSGDDIEAQDILRATSTWYEAYENAYFDYLDKNSEYFDSLPEQPGAAKDNPRVEEYGEKSAPIVMPDIIKQYMALKEADPENAKQVYRANKELLSSAFDAYGAAKLERINALRKIEGYEPISLEVYKNKTFGFDVDGGGFGGGGGRGGRGESSVNNLGDLTNYSNDITAYKPIEAEAMPNLGQLFAALQAGKGGGRSKPRLGASSSGQ